KIAARALGRRLSLDERVLDDIKAKFLRWGRKMPEINARQAMVMEGAQVLANPNGSAPGMYLEYDGRVVVLLPGPPREMKPMFDGLAGQIEERLGDSIFAFRGEKMEEVVGLRLAVGGFTLATAESCTGGLIAHRLTEVPGSSTYFTEGLVTYSNEAKMRLLDVP